MHVLRPLVMVTALLLPCASTLALQESTGGSQPVITVQGQAFQTWDDYKSSALFREAGLRCKLVHESGEAYTQADPSDCTYNFTNPSSEYAPTSLVEIPVVVHCMYKVDGTGFVPETAIKSQILQLNERFRAFSGSVGGAGVDALIQFHLATEDPNGLPTDGIQYRANDQWYSDGGQYWNTLAWDTNRYLNIYLNNAGGFLGYVPALPQQGSPAGNNLDRVVVQWSTVGANAPIGFPYDQGTIAAHEVGHYLGLFHTFNGGCASQGGCASNGDRVCDTPPSSSSAFVCDPVDSCGVPDPFENYMSYGDPCMTGFTAEQILRMRCSIEHYRPNLALSKAPGTWTDLGGGTSGAAGDPTLAGEGLLIGGSIATLDLVNAPNNALLLAWISFTSVPATFFGGTVHATPFANQFLFFADAAGEFSAYTNWPEGLPPGTEAWFQFLVQDPSVVWGITLSNGLKATTP